MHTDASHPTGSGRGGTATPEGIRIDDVHDQARFKELEELQVRVWGSEPQTVVPAHLLYVVASGGGILLGAYDGDTMVGFVLGLLGERDGRLHHMSHMLGVHPDYQGRGIGEALKWRQRERALAQGLDLMTWTFDPLQARNAFFNLHKLGVISRTYCENLYGDLGDDLNRGLPSDRLLVEWLLKVPPLDRSAPLTTPAPILTNDGGKPMLHLEPSPGAGGEVSFMAALSAEVPESIQRIKRENPPQAMAWRLAVRKALSWAFEHGYTASDFAGNAYLLLRDDTLPEGYRP